MRSPTPICRGRGSWARARRTLTPDPSDQIRERSGVNAVPRLHGRRQRVRFRKPLRQWPAAEEMRQSMESVRQWKRDHVNFEPSRSCAVNTRFQQYLDVLLQDLGLNPYRKMPNILAELFSQYGPDDYVGIYEEYQTRQKQRSQPLHALALDTLKANCLEPAPVYLS